MFRMNMNLRSFHLDKNILYLLYLFKDAVDLGDATAATAATAYGS